MASWRSPGLGPARPLTVTLAPRAQLGTRPGLRGRREGAGAWPGAGGAGSSRMARGRLAGRSAADLGNVSHLSWRAGTEHPAPGTHCPSHSPWQAAWHHYPVCPAGRGQCPLLSVGAAHSRRSQGVSLSLGQALAGRRAARTGRLPTATTASWTSSSGSATAPPSRAPPAARAGAPCLLLHAPPLSGLGPEGKQMLPQFPLQCHSYSTFCFLPFLTVLIRQWHGDLELGGLRFWPSLPAHARWPGGASLRVQGCWGMELGLWACLWFLLSADTGIRILGGSNWSVCSPPGWDFLGRDKWGACNLVPGGNLSFSR